MLKQSLLDAIYDKYSEINDYVVDFFEPSTPSPPPPPSQPLNSTSSLSSASNSPMSDSSSSQSQTPSSTDVSFYIPSAYSPRKSRNESGNIKVSISLVMSGLGINHIGNLNDLATICDNVLELDLSKNEIDDWNEIKNLLITLKKLRLLNLSSNKLNHSIKCGPQCCGEKIEVDLDDESDEPPKFTDEQIDHNVKLTVDYFTHEWQLNHNLTTLILNSCHLDLRIIESLLNILKNLTELHLASNNYSKITFSSNFQKPSLKVLYFNNNQLNSWLEVCKLGACFPNMETLVISENQIEHLCHDTTLFKNLNLLIANKLKINDWSSIDHLRKFPSLKHVRMQNIPLLESLSDEEKYFVLVGHLDDSIHSLNGSRITTDDKENCERKYLRYFMDVESKPSRYFELESKHGKLDKLADVNLEIRKKVNVKIKYNGKHVHDKIDVRQTVGDFKKYLEKYVGLPSNRFKVFYVDIEAFSMSVYGPEELKHANRCLYSFNVRDHDEFEIDLKPTSVLHTNISTNSVNTSDSNNQLPYSHLHHLHFHHYNSHMNNNSQYQVPFFQPSSSASSLPTTTRPISIAKAGSKKSSAENSQQQSGKCCCAGVKSRRVKPLSESKPSQTLNKNDRQHVQKKDQTIDSSSSAKKSCSSSSLPANLNECFSNKNTNEINKIAPGTKT